MKTLKDQLLTGERACFQEKNANISHSIFADGESPLKESRHIILTDVSFRWKYPLWYSKNIKATNISLLDTARSGIWYTENIEISDSIIQAPKTFRRCSDVILNRVTLTDAQETMWSCDHINLNQVSVIGDYFAMNSQNVKANNLRITGNYAFDGAENIEISNATLLTKDAFWNCKNVVVRDSRIVGEYLGWNSENVTFINCTIESNQGLCYMKNLVMENCKLINTDLAFEYSTVEADIRSDILSIKNPISGKISADAIGEIIFDDPAIDASETEIELRKVCLCHAL